MKNKFLFTLLLTSLCIVLFIFKSFAQGKTESFKVSKDGMLKTDISGGDIRVKTWEKNEVKIIYDDDDNEYSGVQIKHNGNTISIMSDDYIDFDITVPVEFNLNLNSSGGDISVLNNLKGNARVNTGGGDIELKQVEGELSAATGGGDVSCGNINGEATIRTGGGDIIVGKVSGEGDITSGGGNITIQNVGKSLNIHTGGGNVDCGSVAGDINVITGGGNVTVNNISGSLKITTGGGNISGSSINKGGAIITGSGNVTLENLSGGVKITSGAGDIHVEFVSVGSKESRILSGNGNIILYIPENSKATVYARVKDQVWAVDKKDIAEIIQSDFKAAEENFNKKRGEFSATYNINGGGIEINVETSAGNIEIRKSKR